MKLFIDDANIEAIKRLCDLYPIDGVTTNPSILSKQNRDPKEVLKETSTEKKVLYFENREALESALDELILPGDSILVKASHFMQFEKIVKKLAE